MSNMIEIIIEPFMYKMTLHDNVLQIIAKHIDECFVWSTIIDGMLQDPETIQNDSNIQKQFIVNLDPDEIFELFEAYKSQTLDQSIKITFPTIFKNENEHILITLDIQRAFGKQRHDTKFIILEPENIAKDIINYQKIEHFKQKTITKLDVVDKQIYNLEMIIEGLNKKLMEIYIKIETIEKNICNVNDRLNDEIYDSNEVDTEITLVQNELITKHDCLHKEIKEVQSELTTKHDCIDKRIGGLFKKLSEYDNLQKIIIDVCDKKYQLKT